MVREKTVEPWIIRHLASNGPDYPSRMARKTEEERPPIGTPYLDLLPVRKGDHHRENILASVKELKRKGLLRRVYIIHADHMTFGTERMKSLEEHFGERSVAKELTRARETLSHRSFVWLTPMGIAFALKKGMDADGILHFAELEVVGDSKDFAYYLEGRFAKVRIQEGERRREWDIPVDRIVTICDTWLSQTRSAST